MIFDYHQVVTTSGDSYIQKSILGFRASIILYS